MRKLRKIKGKREISKQAIWQNKRRALGLCPLCGDEPLMIDPKYLRDIRIRSDLQKGMSTLEVGKKYNISDRQVRTIRKEPAGRPRLFNRCEKCLKADSLGHVLKARNLREAAEINKMMENLNTPAAPAPGDSIAP